MGPRSATLRIPQRRLYDSLSKKNRAYSMGFLSKVLKIARRETIASIFIVALLILGLWTSYEIHNISRDIASVHIEENRLMAQRQDLKSQEARLKAVSRMKKIGRELRLHPPADSQIIYLR